MARALFDDTKGAIFSPCRTWRYVLWRKWTAVGDKDCVAFIGLNPSTADELVNDPTITRCVDFAQRWGFGGLVMLNQFAYRSTDPKGLRRVADPVGPQNEAYLLGYAGRVGRVVAAWGADKMTKHQGRAVAVSQRLSQVCDLYCLGTTADGSPKHPLFVRATTELVRYNHSA